MWKPHRDTASPCCRSLEVVHSISSLVFLYLDLTNTEWVVVEITPAGWKVTRNPPIKFRRSRGMTKIPRETLHSKPPSHALETGLSQCLLTDRALAVLEAFERIRDGMLFGPPAGTDVY